MINGIIYKAINEENGKVYIGQTIIGFEHRRRAHISSANNINTTSTYFHRALKKYGEDGFKWEIIDKVDDFEVLQEREIYWIEFYDSFGKGGYNLTKGGGGTLGRNPSQESRDKQARTMKRIWSEGSIKKPSVTGEGIPPTYLSREDVLKIKDLLIEGSVNAREIAERFAINEHSIKSIRNGHSWRSVISEEDISRMRESFHKTIESEVFLIVDMLKEGIKTVREIASIFDVKESVVYSIKKGVSWTNFITEEDVKDMNDKRIKRGGKISKDTIMEIKDLLIEGVLSQREIAIKVNASDTTVSSIKSGNLWSEMLTEEELKIINQGSRTKLTADALNEIERILSEGIINQNEVAKMFNISATRVSNIKNGRVQIYLNNKL